MSKLTLDEYLTVDCKLRNKARTRLESIRQAILDECVSYGELAELQSLIKHIEPGDMLLQEWAGVPESEAI